VRNLLVPESEKGRAYTRPASGTLESPHRSAIDTPPAGGVASKRRPVLQSFQGFEADSSRSYAKWIVIGLRVWGGEWWVGGPRLRSDELRRDKESGR